MDFMTIVRSMRRSDLRARGMKRLHERRRAYLGLLAEDLDISVRDARRVMFGRMPHYAPRLSPVRLGLVRVVRRGRRIELEITPLGDRVVAELSSIRGRRSSSAVPGR